MIEITMVVVVSLVAGFGALLVLKKEYSVSTKSLSRYDVSAPLVPCGDYERNKSSRVSLDEALAKGKDIPPVADFGELEKLVLDTPKQSILLDDASLLEKSEVFPVIVQGSSMEREGIIEGDLLWIMKKPEELQVGDFVLIKSEDSEELKIRQLEKSVESGWWGTASHYLWGSNYGKHHFNQVMGVVVFHTPQAA